jgi:hypothetical protein
MTKSRKDEVLYVSLSFLQAFNALTWVQILYNEPSAVKSKSGIEWTILITISLFLVLGQTLTTWKAYLSDPNKKDEIK